MTVSQHLVALSLFALSFAPPAYADAPSLDTSARIAVIGAGPSGLTAAWDLKQAGYGNVVVFEKNPRAGGKVETLMLEGDYYDMGASFVLPTYDTVLDLAGDMGIETRLVPHVRTALRDGVWMSEKDYFEPPPFRSRFATMRMARTVERYKSVGTAEYHLAEPGLGMNFLDFADLNGFSTLGERLGRYVTIIGYGYPEEVAALYYIRPLLWLVEMNEGQSHLRRSKRRPIDYFEIDGGNQRLWDALAEKLDVRFDTEVQSVERPEQGPIKVTHASGSEAFDYLIVATGIHNAHHFMDLTDDTRDLFAKTKTYTYRTVAFRSQDLPKEYSQAIEVNALKGEGAPVMLLHNPWDGDIHVSYQLVPDGMDEAGARADFESSLAELGVGVEEILAERSWAYFPHVSGEEIEAGYYRKVFALQGQRNTLYVGGSLNFDSMEDSARHAREVVKGFILAPPTP